MADYKAGFLVIGVFIYFLIFFLVVNSIENIQNIYNQGDSDINYSGSTYVDKLAIFGNTDITAVCTGSSPKKVSLFEGLSGQGLFSCRKLGDEQVSDSGLRTSNIDNDTCIDVKNCEWRESFVIFNFTLSPGGCEGRINLTYYGINISNEAEVDNYCEASGLQDPYLCAVMDCEWVSFDNYMNNFYNSGDDVSFVGFFSTVGNIISFRADLGMGIWNWLISLLFFYIPSLLFVWGIVRSVTPW